MKELEFDDMVVGFVVKEEMLNFLVRILFMLRVYIDFVWLFVIYINFLVFIYSVFG